MEGLHMSHDDNLIRFTGDAARLPEDEKTRLKPELAAVSRQLTPGRPPCEVNASDLFDERFPGVLRRLRAPERTRVGG